MSPPPGVALARPALGSYRQPVLEILRERLGGGLTVYAGDADFEPTSRTGIDLGPDQVRVTNRYLLGRRLLWQSGCLRGLVRADVAVLELNPRMLSSWAVMGARRGLRRPTVLWGHAFPRAGRDARSDRLRAAMRSFADVVVVYTETERRHVSERHPGARVLAAPNALYPRERIGPATPAGGLPGSFVYVGRLVATKKPGLLLEGFLRARSELPAGARLVFVGDGPVRPELERDAAAAGAADAVSVLGRVTDFERLRSVYAEAIASVSPGEVGLTIVQSLGFGVPMAIARDEGTAPRSRRPPRAATACSSSPTRLTRWPRRW